MSETPAPPQTSPETPRPNIGCQVMAIFAVVAVVGFFSLFGYCSAILLSFDHRMQERADLMFNLIPIVAIAIVLGASFLILHRRK